MQQYKRSFKEETITNTTIGNVQSCIRLNDMDMLGDGTHLAYFNMIGTFSFRHWTVPQTIVFWNTFLDKIGVVPTHVTVHPDKQDWSSHHKYPVKLDPECVWSDGDIGGYCTEYYVNEVEIGNIVNPLGSCIDVGFGLERLCYVIEPKPSSEVECLQECIMKLIECGIKPSHYKEGHFLRRLLRKLVSLNGSLQHELFQQELLRQKRLDEKYEKMKVKYAHMPSSWWYDTHGIDITLYK